MGHNLVQVPEEWIAAAFDERIPMWAREYASNAATDAIRVRKAAAIKEHAY